MMVYSKCSRCERTAEAKQVVAAVYIAPPDWGEVIVQVTDHGELARSFTFCEQCRPYVLVGVDQLLNGKA